MEIKARLSWQISTRWFGSVCYIFLTQLESIDFLKNAYSTQKSATSYQNNIGQQLLKAWLSPETRFQKN